MRRFAAVDRRSSPSCARRGPLDPGLRAAEVELLVDASPNRARRSSSTPCAGSVAHVASRGDARRLRCSRILTGVKVLLRNPRREIEVAGPITVVKLLQRLDINPETVLVIQGDTLVTRDARLADTDDIEIRPVTSGG